MGYSGGNFNPENIDIAFESKKREIQITNKGMELSLNEIASKCEEFQAGLQIGKVAIYKRMEKCSVFLKEIFKKAMDTTVKNALSLQTSGIICGSKDVKICDSTKITLPDKLSDLWPELGGRSGKSAIKIIAWPPNYFQALS